MNREIEERVKELAVLCRDNKYACLAITSNANMGFSNICGDRTWLVSAMENLCEQDEEYEILLLQVLLSVAARKKDAGLDKIVEFLADDFLHKMLNKLKEGGSGDGK